MSPANALAGSRMGVEKPPRLPSELVHDRFHPLQHVVSARAGEATVLMDVKQGTYHTLNEVGGRIWELVRAGVGVVTIIERLLDEYDVPRLQLEADVVVAVRQLLANRLIAPGEMPSRPPAERKPKPAVQAIAKNRELRVPSVLRCGIMILVVKAMLKARGFAWTMDWMRRQMEKVPDVVSVEVNAVRPIENAVAMAGALYPGRALCLEQSLVLYYLLRRQRVGVQYCQGVQPYPFEAHAWVEYRGEVINDIPEHVKGFALLPRALP
jgi:hypothetical protein